MNSLHLDLSGRVIAVTGASGALGSGVTAKLRGFGAKVAQLDHAPAPPNQQQREMVFSGTDFSDLKWRRH